MNWVTQILDGLSKPFKWWVIVAPWEQGLRVRLGKEAVFLAPGPHWKIPFLDRTYVQSVRSRTVSEDNQTLMSKDGKVFVISFALRFAIGDIKQLYNTLCNPENTMLSIVNSELARVVSSMRSEEITQEKIQEQVDVGIANLKEFGITDSHFMLTEIASPRVYRLITNDYRISSGLYDIEGDNSGEKK